MPQGEDDYMKIRLCLSSYHEGEGGFPSVSGIMVELIRPITSRSGWISLQILDVTSANGYSLMPVGQHGAALSMIRS